MKKAFLIVFASTPWLIGISLISYWIWTGEMSHYRQKRIESIREYQEIENNKKQALNGDRSAMYWLYEYYAIYEHDRAEAQKWLKLSAENGSVLGMASYGMNLCEEGSRKEGIEFLKKACKRGNKQACELTKDCLEGNL